ncbi:MAG TPA: hypothetical protein VGF67_16110 [Ktedonobacteraceae bacterium]
MRPVGDPGRRHRLRQLALPVEVKRHAHHGFRLAFSLATGSDRQTVQRARLRSLSPKPGANAALLRLLRCAGSILHLL